MAISKVILDGTTLMDVTDSTSTPGTMLDGTVGYQANGVRAVGTTTVPTKTSDLQNDSNFVSDASYVHTDNNFTTTLKNKLDGIASGAEVNQNAFSNVKVGSSTIQADGKTDTLELAAGSNITLTPDTSSDKVTIAATDTTYSDATTSASGLMSSSDKTKLNGIATGAEVNQNAFSTVKVGTTDLAADSKTDTLTITAGSNITLTPTASSDSFTIAATDTTYSNATTSADGLMSSSDKTKLNGIATGAEVNQNAFSTVMAGNVSLPSTSKTGTLEVIAGSNITFATSTASTNPQLTIKATNTTYSDATQSTHGLMSTTDKTKLDGIASGAEVNVQANWTETNSTSDAYIQNKPNLSTVATSGSYADLSNKPTIPTATSQLTNDSGFIDATAIANKMEDDAPLFKTTLQNITVSSTNSGSNFSNNFDISNPPSGYVCLGIIQWDWVSGTRQNWFNNYGLWANKTTIHVKFCNVHASSAANGVLEVCLLWARSDNTAHYAD